MKILRPLLLVIAASLGAFGLQHVAPIAKAAMWQWSTTSSSNATADPSINWAEGMSPSSVNDSARAMMSVLASWRNDLGAVTATTGTSTAFALTSNQGGFVANAAHDGFIIGFIPNVTNAAGGTTINVDSTSAKPLRAQTGVALPSGSVVLGSKYLASYRFSTDEWLLLNNFPSLFEVPLGALLPFTGDAAPNANFILPFGQCISRTTYATYFALVGTRFGACDGVTTFAAPDMRGRFPGGNDEMGGSAANRITIGGCISNFFNVVGFTCGAQTHTLTEAQMPAHAHGSGSYSSSYAVTTFVSEAIANASDGTRTYGNALAAQGIAISGSSSTVGSSSAFPRMNPSIVVNYILRVL